MTPSDPDDSGKGVPPAKASVKDRWERLMAWRATHERHEIATFFLAGMLFDIFTLSRIDSLSNILQQVAYLSVLAALLLYAERVDLGLSKPQGWFAKVWSFHEDGIHFLLGSLLSAFSLFYFIGSSGWNSLIFMLVIFGLLVLNELPQFRHLGPWVRTGLFALCLLTFLSFLIPVLAGRLSIWFFVLAVLGTAAAGAGMVAILKHWTGHLRLSFMRMGAPFAGVIALIVVFYLAKAIPPLPLHSQAMGIYHQVEVTTVNGARAYQLSHQRPAWKFWEHGDQTFLYRPGDRVYVFVRIFAPGEFRDAIRFRWEYRHPDKGWVQAGKPHQSAISGGRDNGFRTFAFMSQPDRTKETGKSKTRWRVTVETSTGQVVAQMYFKVLNDDSSDERVFKTALD